MSSSLNDLSMLEPSGFYPNNEFSYENRLLILRDIIIQRNSFMFISNEKTDAIEPVTQKQLEVQLPPIYDPTKRKVIKRKLWSEEDMILAIHDHKTKGHSIRHLSIKYGIPKTTLSSRLKKSKTNINI